MESTQLMSTQSEAILENNLIQQLEGLGYASVRITDEIGMRSNLKQQLERFNETSFSEREFESILNYLGKGNVFERAKLLRDRFELRRDNDDLMYVRFFHPSDFKKNLFQVTNQITIQGVHKNRYDVTLLINGLPLVQIELKRRGIELKEAFNQIDRYKQGSYWSNLGLFQFVQLFVISNGVNTKYYVNNTVKALTFKQTFFWADVQNRNITDLSPFANSFLNLEHLHRMLSKYVVLNETHKMLMVLRPYQYYAVEAIVDKVRSRPVELLDEQVRENNGYIWHTTGSGKTLTSFKTSQIITQLPEVKKVVFVVDRKDLDYQTMEEFNSFKKGSVDVTNNTASLIKQFKDDTKLIVTTIQKLNNAISKKNYEQSISHLKNERVVFIFDECHRSQFGDTHNRITNYFKNHQLFGFTGTPIFADNAMTNQKGKRTTKDLFHECLHKYVITDAIRDQNVLRFNVEYYTTVKRKKQTTIIAEEKVEDIDTREALESPKRFEHIVNHIISIHDRKTHSRTYSAMFAVSSIENLIKYYDLFKSKKEAGEHNLRIATIFSYGANEEDEEDRAALPDEETLAEEEKGIYRSNHSRDKLIEFVKDYNSMYRVSFDIEADHGYERYFQDLSRRMKHREKLTFKEEDRLDILLVVGMFLTGFDAKKLNTLYVDKNLKHHGLIQAYSRTNRILNEQKSQGNILCYRNLKAATDEAVALFSNKEANEVIFLPKYEEMVRKFGEALGKLMLITPTVKSVNDLQSEEDIAKFVQAFRELMRVHNVLKTYTEFTWDDLPMSEQAFADFTSKYLDIREATKRQEGKEKESILNDIDFEVELIHSDTINVAYILKLLAKQKQTTDSQEKKKQLKQIHDLLSGEVALRNKRELIEKFIEEQLPRISDADNIEDEFKRFWEEQRILALHKLCEEEHLDQQQFSNLIDTYVFNGQEPLKENVFGCLEQRPSILRAREIGERIIERMKEFVEIFINGMVA